MYSLYQELKDKRISLSYLGVFTDKITDMLIQLSESYVTKDNSLSKLSKRSSFLIAESFQNLVRHGIMERSDFDKLKYNKDFFQINILSDRITISSVNVLKNSTVSGLAYKIKHVNSLNKDELKELRNEILQHGTLSSKGGAGLGLIEMVRKSGLPLLHKFVSLNDNYSLLILSMEIPISKKETEHIISVDSIEKVYKRLVEDEIFILYKGDFSSSSNLNLVGMLENNFMNGNGIRSEKGKNIAAIIEVMQNVSKHGKVIDKHKEGVLALSLLNGELYIECSNFIAQENYDDLKEKLKDVKESTMEEIEQKYMDKLRNALVDEDEGGLGLFEIARFSQNTFTYNFTETQDNELFYSIKMKTF